MYMYHSLPGVTGVLLSSPASGLVEDVLIVPVNIAYDRIVERDFVKAELMVGGVRVHCACVAL